MVVARFTAYSHAAGRALVGAVIGLGLLGAASSGHAEAPLPRYIDSWLVAGPFDNADYRGFDRDFIGETRVEPRPGAAAGDRKWLPFDDRLYCRNYDDYNDLYTFFHPEREGSPGGPHEWAVAYAHVYVWSPEKRSVELRVGSNDGFKAWLNGVEVASVEGKLRQAARDTDRVPVTLESGWNRLLLKVANAYGLWGFYVRLCGADGAPIDGLEYATDAPGGTLRVTTAALPRGYAEWPYLWLQLNIPEAERKNTLAEIEVNNPSASPLRLEAAGGTPPYRWRVVEGSLPEGLELDEAEGEIRGICGNPQRAEFTVEVTDGRGATARARQTLEVAERPTAWHERARLGALIHNSGSPNGKGWLGDPERQAALMAAAGYAYAAPMSKNDSGFAYWPTDVKNSAGKPTGVWRDRLETPDLLGPLTEALRARGIRVGYYYPYIEYENNGLGGDDYANNFPRFMDLRLAQVEELCLRYRPAVMWFDGANVIYTKYREGDPRTNHELDALYSLIKTLVPECLVMGNAGREVEYGMGDVDVLVDESEGNETLDWYWGRWPKGQAGYSPKKMPVEVWRFPNNGASFLGGNEFFDWKEWARVVVSMGCEGFLCNLDHTEWSERRTHRERMKLAEWIKPRLCALEGTRPGPLRDDLWGYNVIKDNTLYLHILRNERGKYGFQGKSGLGLPEHMQGLLEGRGYAPGLQNEMKVGPLPGPVARVYQVPLDMDLEYKVEGEELIIDLRRLVVDDVDTIIAVDLEKAETAVRDVTPAYVADAALAVEREAAARSVRPAAEGERNDGMSVRQAVDTSTTVAAREAVGVSGEWNAARALREWPDQRGIWTPLSWCDSLYEYNVFFDGTVTASSYGAYGFNRRAFPEDQAMGFTLTPRAYAGGSVSQENASYYVRRFRNPDGQYRYRWAASRAPELIVEKPLGGILLEQRQFAHLAGGGPTERGDEPLFLWMRFVVTDVIDIVNDVDRVTVALTPQNDHISSSMEAFNNVIFFNKPPFYPLPLHYVGDSRLGEPGYLRVFEREFGRRNRLAFPAQPDRNLEVTWMPIKRFLEDNFEYAKSTTLFEQLMVSMPCKEGACFDVLVPFRQEDDETIARELALGYDGAREETERFWAERLRPTARLRVPEPLVQAHIDHFAPLSFMVSERHPLIGDPVLLTGSFSYGAIWPTAQALQLTALDRLGYGDDVARYLEIYRKTQGTVKPPSPYLEQHPGYFANAQQYKAVDWMTDHSAVLYAAAFHGLLTEDPDFLARWLEPIVKGCEWIADARGNRAHSGRPGLLPAGVANDALTNEQQTWNDAWAYKALVTAVRLLERLGDPRAAKFRAEAEDYRETFQRHFRDVVEKAPRWTAPDGEELPLVPTAVGEANPASMKHSFYLDTGPMVLAWSGLMSADDPIMRASVRWYREGPQWRHFRQYSEHSLMPVLDREISTCEPCYSWNIYHTLELGDRERFSMGLYGLIAGGASQQTYVSSETREGVFGHVFSTMTFLHLLFGSAIEDMTEELHLLRMLPLAFYRDGGFDWENVPTTFGPLGLGAAVSSDGRRLEVRFVPPSRRQPARTVLHVPPFEGLESVVVNGQEMSSVGGRIVLEPARPAPGSSQSTRDRT